MSRGSLSVFNVQILKPSLKRDNGPLHFTSIFEICSEEYLFAALVRDVKLGYFEILYDKIFIYYKNQTNTIFLYFLPEVFLRGREKEQSDQTRPIFSTTRRRLSALCHKRSGLRQWPKFVPASVKIKTVMSSIN